jgi:hypothetical protein
MNKGDAMNNNMRPVIITKYFGPSNTRGTRIKASARDRAVYVPWDYELSIEDNHLAAAQALVHELWPDNAENPELHGGPMPNGDGYAFVLIRK